MLVCAQVVAFPVLGHGGAVSVSREFVDFGGFQVGIVHCMVRACEAPRVFIYGFEGSKPGNY